MKRSDIPTIDWVPVRDGLGRSLEVGKYPVTIGQFEPFIAADGYATESLWSRQGWQWRCSVGITLPSYWNEADYREDEMLAVTGVSFWEAEAFARFVAVRYAGARLPSECEWWWAASNGGHDRYPWGDTEISSSNAQMTFFGHFQPGRISRVDAHPAGVSKFGIHDLIGNVAEWCYPGARHTLPASTGSAVLRGGASWHTPVNLDNSFRDVLSPATRDNNSGIRLVRGEPLNLRRIDEHQRDDKRSLVLEIPAVKQNVPRPTRPFRQEGLASGGALGNWQLRIDGLVQRPRKFSLKQLQQDFPICEEKGFLVCVCKWAAWVTVKGIRVGDVLQSLGLQDDHTTLYLNCSSLPGSTGKAYETSFSLSEAISNEALLVFEMDGKPLTNEFGAPLRTLNFHTYGYKHVKAVSHISVSRISKPGWWETQKQYDFRGTIRPGTYTLVGNPALRLTVNTNGRIVPTAEVEDFLRLRSSKE